MNELEMQEILRATIHPIRLAPRHHAIKFVKAHPTLTSAGVQPFN
jgi:hypothetical protein